MTRLAPFSIRLTENERRSLEDKAGGRPLATYIKAVVLDESSDRLRKTRPLPQEDQVLLAQILARLGQSRSASNLNQIANALHQGTLILDDQLVRDLNQACLDVAWMRTTLMEALGSRRKMETPA